MITISRAGLANFNRRAVLTLMTALSLTALENSALAQVNVAPANNAKTPPPQIAVSPSRVSLEIGESPANGSIQLLNLGDKTISVRASIANFDLDESNLVREIAPTAQSLDQWLIFNPVSFQVPPGGEQVVRFSVRPRARPEPGEHRAMMFFQEDTAGDIPIEGLRAVFRLGVAIYGLAEPVVRRSILHDINFSDSPRSLQALFDVESTGNTHVRMSGQYSIWPAEQFPGEEDIRDYNLNPGSDDRPLALVNAGKLPSTPVLPGTRRKILLDAGKPPEPGSYVLHLRGKLNDQPFSRTVPLLIE